MKILIPVLHYYPVIGGLETWTENIAERLSGKAKIFIVTGKAEKQPKRETKSGVDIFRTSLFPLKNFSYSSPTFILTALPFIFFRSLALIKKEKINLLHCQGFLSSFLGYFLSKFSGIPYIVTVQRLEKEGFLRGLVYRNAEVCIGASSAIKDYFQKIGARNIEVIPNGIDLSRFENLERKPHEGFVVLAVARLEKVKGIEYLIRAFASQALNSLSARLIIIGDGSDRRRLEDLTKQLGLQDKVKFAGQVSNEEIPGYLAAADCFVLSSLKEGFGIVLLEAQAAGIPVVGTKIGGILDIIEDEKTGILVEPKNPEAIALAIHKIRSEPEFARNLAKNAKLNLAEKYDWRNIAEKVYKIYENCISHGDISS